MRRWWGWLLLVGLWVSGAPRPVAAAGAGFTVTPQLPVTQLGGDTGYFNLAVVPGTAQTLTVVVANQSDAAKNMRVQMTDAFTTDTGQISYDPGASKDASAKVRLSEISSAPVTFKLAAHEARPVSLTVVPPASGFIGQVLGGIFVQDRTAYAAGSQSSTPLGLANQFALVVGVQLQVSQTLVAPRMKLVSVQPGTQAGQPAVLARLQNDQPRLFGEMTIRATVTPDPGTRTIVTRTVQNFAMAPNSHFDFAVFPPTTLAPGRYWLDLTATTGKYRWQFRTRFTVVGDERTGTTGPALFGLPWWLIALIVVGLLLLLAVLAWWRRRQTETTAD
ncbi:DUF916 and DUF3324 domain-containing protein [Lacticaseibacillus daqingensis]|uniref:DUF916 and DUF3324 domain-containing protein n=1 Tax=Lacticaseibacillus daqingensis TaxID=2486014 RepID=UPI000F7A5613|nr:DUF916 and DUF3324 domain-containing protein [Lacticaseibacillus daqingensis]